MKKKEILYLALLILIFPAMVKAANTTCEYKGSYSYEQYGGVKSEDVTINCTFYDTGGYSCYASTSKSQQIISNWSTAASGFKAKDYFEQNNTCFPYMVFLDKGSLFNRYEIYGADTYETASSISIDLTTKSTGYFSGIMSISSPDERDAAEEMYEKIDTYTAFLQKMKTDEDPWELNKCLDSEGHLDSNSVMYDVCKTRLQQFYEDINTWQSEINEAINSGLIDANNKSVQEFNKAVQNARSKVNETTDKIIQEQHEKENNNENNSTNKNEEYETADLSQFCEEVRVQNSLKFLGYLLMIVKIVVPLLLIIFGVIDYAKAVVASDDKALKSSTSSFVTRIAAGVIIFLLPTIINFVFGLVAGANTGMKYAKCRTCIFNPKECGTINLTSKR